MKFLIMMCLIFTNFVYAKGPLTLDYKAEVQMKVGETWITHSVRYVRHGVGGLQVWLDPQGQHRLKLIARKPFDIKGSFRVRMPSRVDGKVASKNSETVTIIFGPHDGCPITENRCKPLTENDFGNVELRLDLEKSEQSSLGVMLLRPYKDNMDFAIRPALTYKDKELPCNSTIQKGFWIFASSIGVSTVDSISICVREPDGNVECAKDGQTETKIRANKAGTYEFTAWNSSPYSTTCMVRAE